jgi:hypothetical protein
MALYSSDTYADSARYFEEFVKRNFDDEEDTEVSVPLPGLPDNEEAGLDCGFLSMNRLQIKDIVDPVVSEVIALVEGQVDCIRRDHGDKVSGIILVGGFGQSNYL